MKKLSMLVALMCMIIPTMMQVQAQGIKDSIVGSWINEDGDELKIYEVDNKYYVKIVELKEPIDPDTGKPKLDVNNPDPILKKRELKGLVFLVDCIFDNDEWIGGKIYNYKNGETKNCDMKFTNASDLNRLRVRTLRRIFNKTTYWTKKKN